MMNEMSADCTPRRIGMKQTVRLISGAALFLLLVLASLFNALPDAAYPVRTANSPPLNRLASEKIRHDALFQNRLPGGRIFQQNRNQRLSGRIGTRRLFQLDISRCPASAILPSVIPDDSDGLNPCRNPFFHYSRNHSFPVRAGPGLIS